MTETRAFLTLLDERGLRQLRDEFLALAYDSGSWRKWYDGVPATISSGASRPGITSSQPLPSAISSARRKRPARDGRRRSTLRWGTYSTTHWSATRLRYGNSATRGDTVDYIKSLLAAGPSSDSSWPDLASVKVVRKHWGEERWLVAEDSPFGFKVISALAGKRTSLQDHNAKEEANLILSGEGRLDLRQPGLRSPRRVSAQARSDRPCPARNGAPDQGGHRPVIVEVSTPELDDVVRLEDDLGRGDGRIDAEHCA